MVFVIRDLATRTFGYQIIQNNNGIQRILDEAHGWEGPTEVLQFIDDLGKAINEGVKTTFK